MSEIRASTVLPARREPLTLHTADGLDLVGELALPAGPGSGGHAGLPAPAAHARRDDGQPRAAQGLLPAARAGRPGRAAVQHPGHRSARGRARASSATARPSGSTWPRRSTGASRPGCPGSGCWAGRSAPNWRCGGALTGVEGAILLSPPLRRATDADLDAWAASGKPLLALVPSSTTTCARTRRGAGSPGSRRPSCRGRRGQAPVGRRAVRPARAERDRAPGRTRPPRRCPPTWED